MAATMKTRRSSSKRKSTRGAERYDVRLRRAKKIKKSGGNFLVKSKVTGKKVPAHTVCKENFEYKGIKVLQPKESK